MEVVATERERILALLRTQRAIAGVPRAPRIIPRQHMPDAIALEYRAAIIALMRRAYQFLDPLLEELPALLESARRERGDDARIDAGESRRVRELVDRARRWFGESIKTDDIERLAADFAQQTSTYQRIQLSRQVRAVLGVDVFAADKFLPALVDGFVHENAQLIVNVAPKVYDGVEAAALRAIQNGTLSRDLMAEIEGQFQLGEKRSKLIARDQIGKLYGQINAARQREMGVRRFRWRTVRDRRVRGTPGGAFPRAKPSHYHREGKIYMYGALPPGVLEPGVEILCRCYGEPVLEDLLEGL